MESKIKYSIIGRYVYVVFATVSIIWCIWIGVKFNQIVNHIEYPTVRAMPHFGELDGLLAVLGMTFTMITVVISPHLWRKEVDEYEDFEEVEGTFYKRKTE